MGFFNKALTFAERGSAEEAVHQLEHNDDPTGREIQKAEQEIPAHHDRVIDRSWGARMGIFCSGAALMTGGYFNSLMSPVNLVFNAKYPETYTSTMSTRVSNALLIGEIIGMLFVGLTCDFMGRKWAMITTTMCIIIGGILATAAHGTTTAGMFWMIVVMRGVIGFGTGGEYPASSTTAAESANESVKHRGRIFILVTNLPLSLGTPFCYTVFLIVWCAAGGADHYSTIWRVCFGIGCIWPVFIFIFRWKTQKSVIFSKSRFMNWSLPWHRVVMFYWKRLVGTCLAWAIYDFITFPNGIFSGLIIEDVVGNGDIKKTAEWQLLLGWIAIPGVIIGAFLCDIIGRKWTLIAGFAGYLIFGLVIGCAFDQISNITALFVVFYGLFNSCGNMGPGDMMGILSTELYATPVRGTLYGFSAACGKAGAAIGTQVFRQIQNNLGKRWTFIISAIVGCSGILVTLLFIPNLKEEDLGFEDQVFIAYLRKHGYQGQIGDDKPDASDSDNGSVDDKKDHMVSVRPLDHERSRSDSEDGGGISYVR